MSTSLYPCQCAQEAQVFSHIFALCMAVIQRCAMREGGEEQSDKLR
jgi:hypothetical protein